VARLKNKLELRNGQKAHKIMSRKARLRTAVGLNAKLSMLKDGEHYTQDLKVPAGEKTLLKNPDPEEKNVEKSKAELARMPISWASRRDAMIDYMNPREELPKFTKGVDQIPPFDKGPFSLLTPYDDLAMQQVNKVILGRSNYVLEEGKYDITIDNQKEKAEAMRSKAMKTGTSTTQKDPGVTPSMARELRRASFMESSQAL